MQRSKLLAGTDILRELDLTPHGLLELIQEGRIAPVADSTGRPFEPGEAPPGPGSEYTPDQVRGMIRETYATMRGQTGYAAISDERLCEMAAGMQAQRQYWPRRPERAWHHLGDGRAKEALTWFYRKDDVGTLRAAVAPVQSLPAGRSGTFYRKGETWVLALDGKEALFRDAAGFRFLHTLLSNPDARISAQSVYHRGAATPFLQEDEKPRKNVQKAIARVEGKIYDALPAMRAHLAVTIHKGFSCSYEPMKDPPVINWTLHAPG